MFNHEAMPVIELENQILRKISSGGKQFTYAKGKKDGHMEHLACFSGKFNFWDLRVYLCTVQLNLSFF